MTQLAAVWGMHVFPPKASENEMQHGPGPRVFPALQTFSLSLLPAPSPHGYPIGIENFTRPAEAELLVFTS